MSVQTELNRILNLKNNIRTKLNSLGVLNNADANLSQCNTALQTIDKYTGSTTVTEKGVLSVGGKYVPSDISIDISLTKIGEVTLKDKSNNNDFLEANGSFIDTKNYSPELAEVLPFLPPADLSYAKNFFDVDYNGEYYLGLNKSGVWKSTDLKSWVLVFSEFYGYKIRWFKNKWVMACQPVNSSPPDVSRNGIAYSEDGGQSWTKVIIGEGVRIYTPTLEIKGDYIYYAFHWDSAEWLYYSTDLISWTLVINSTYVDEYMMRLLKANERVFFTFNASTTSLSLYEVVDTKVSEISIPSKFYVNIARILFHNNKYFICPDRTSVYKINYADNLSATTTYKTIEWPPSTCYGGIPFTLANRLLFYSGESSTHASWYSLQSDMTWRYLYSTKGSYGSQNFCTTQNIKDRVILIGSEEGSWTTSLDNYNQGGYIASLRKLPDYQNAYIKVR